MVKNVVYFERRFPNILSDIRNFLSDNLDYQLDGDKVINRFKPEVVVRLWLTNKLNNGAPRLTTEYKKMAKHVLTTIKKDSKLFKSF